MTNEKELMQLEKQYWEAIKQKDFDTAERLTDDPCLVAGAKGIARIDKKKFREIMEGSTSTLRDFELKEFEVRMIKEDVAILAYTVHENLTVDGKPLSMDAAESSTWIKRNGRWVCALHTESLAGDPYGRDRKKAA